MFVLVPDLPRPIRVTWWPRLVLPKAGAEIQGEPNDLPKLLTVADSHTVGTLIYWAAYMTSDRSCSASGDG